MDLYVVDYIDTNRINNKNKTHHQISLQILFYTLLHRVNVCFLCHDVLISPQDFWYQISVPFHVFIYPVQCPAFISKSANEQSIDHGDSKKCLIASKEDILIKNYRYLKVFPKHSAIS